MGVTSAVHRSLPRRIFGCPLALAGLGFLLILVAAISSRRVDHPSFPGKLQASQENLTWRAPVETKYRPLTVADTRTTFELRNVGGRVVRILEVKSSCGCATPRVEPTSIAPGGTGTVEIQALPLQVGERVANVTLITDSPITPRVVLQLRIIGSRRPPLLLTAAGDLSFVASPEEELAREIVATTVEHAESEPTPPIIKTDVQALELTGLTLRAEAPSVEPGTVSREYAGQAKLATGTHRGTFTGSVAVVDPWGPERVEELRVHGEILPMLSAVPPRILLRLNRSGSGGKICAAFAVVSRRPAPEFSAELEDNEAPLTISDPQSLGDAQRVLFTISVMAAEPREGVYRIRIRERSGGDSISVHGAVRVEGSS